jgi:hypothetical protein
MMASERPSGRVAFDYKLMHERSTCRWGSPEPRNGCSRDRRALVVSADANEGEQADAGIVKMR